MANPLRWATWALLFFSLTCSGASMDTFDWQATESAPKNYVMSIISGSLAYPGGSLYVPDKSDIDHGWGKGASSHVVGPDQKPLPRSLEITFFSYTENQFYRGRFELPYAKILALFQAGYYSPNEGGHTTYSQVVVGVAPGGAVAVWLRGIEKTTEVFFGQAEKVDLDWSVMTSNASMSREEYVRRGIQDSLKTPEAIAALNKNGPPIGLWNRYRTQYHWQPLFTGMSLQDNRIRSLKYFNGELEYLIYPLDKTAAASTRAIPSELVFIWERKNAKARRFELYFDETEIFDAFKHLSSNNQPLQLEMRIEIVEGKEMFSVALRNDKESVKLKRTNLETYGVREK